jgi:glutamyl endopeptidase
MPPEEHVRVDNFSQLSESTTLEVGEAPRVVKNAVTLPYYQPPKPRRRRGFIQESAVMIGGGEETSAFESAGPILDVSVASFGYTDILETVFGNDDRVKVSQDNMRDNPWRQICSLRIRSQRGREYVGTGWFIAPKVLATAGHCVYLTQEGGWPESIAVIPARYGGGGPFGSVTATRFATVKGWTIKKERDFDYGVIFLEDDDAGKKVGNFEVRALSDRELKGVAAKVSGYPADRDSAQFQYYHERPVMDVTSGRLMYDIDTFGGQSGSPLFQEIEGEGVVAVGIHTTGGVTSNSGTRISEDVITNMLAWLEV